MAFKIFGLFVLFCFAGVGAQTPSQFQAQFNQLMSKVNQSLFNAYDTITAPLGPVRDGLIAQIDSIPGLLDSFTTLADDNSDLWMPIRSVYDDAIASAKTIIEANADHTETVIDMAFWTADARARGNLSLAFNTFYSQSNVVFQMLYAGLSNPFTIIKTIKCIQLHWSKVEAAAKAFNTTIPSCVSKATFNFAPVNTYIAQAKSIITSKYNKFAGCANGVTSSSPPAVIGKALMCIGYELGLMPYTASKISIAILMAGITTQDIITAQELIIYNCYQPIFKSVGTQMTSLITSFTSCMK